MKTLNKTDSFIISTALNSYSCHLSMLNQYIFERPMDSEKVKRYGRHIKADKALLRSYGINFAGDSGYMAWTDATTSQKRKLREAEVRAENETQR